MQDEVFMRKAIELSRLAVEHGNEPFGAVLVKDNEMVFTNENQIYTRHDPTFHGEAWFMLQVIWNWRKSLEMKDVIVLKWYLTILSGSHRLRQVYCARKVW